MPINIDARDIDIVSDELLMPAAEAIKNGGIIIFPTDTVYGIAANAFKQDSILKIYDLKKRPRSMPLIMLVESKKKLKGLIKRPNVPIVKSIEDKFWPGALTIIYKKTSKVLSELSGGGETVGVRLPNSAIAKKIIELAGVPVATTSANITGEKTPFRLSDISSELLQGADVVVDGGECKIGVESTVIDLSGVQPKILREGAISKKEIEEMIK